MLCMECVISGRASLPNDDNGNSSTRVALTVHTVILYVNSNFMCTLTFSCSSKIHCIHLHVVVLLTFVMK